LFIAWYLESSQNAATLFVTVLEFDLPSAFGYPELAVVFFNLTFDWAGHQVGDRRNPIIAPVMNRHHKSFYLAF
jgi:hypothetical protein